MTPTLFTEKKNWLIQGFPEWVQKLWNEWELRSVVLLSVFFQTLLIFLGDHRRHNRKFLVRIILWISYLGADWVAAVALGILSHNNSMEQHKSNELPALWAPFLLLHLGGPDTITAFSVEDNELWLRHLLGLVIQGSIASYVSFRYWRGTKVSILSLIMYVPAIVKYGERTWVLCSASKKQLRDSMLRRHLDPVQSYTELMDEYNSKEEEGFRVRIERGHESPQGVAVVLDESQDDVGGDDDWWALAQAHHFFGIFKCLFAFLNLRYEVLVESKSYFQKLSYRDAFKLVDIELGFMFDVLYTKAAKCYSKRGCILRSITLFFTISVFVVFILNVDNNKQRHRHPLMAGTSTDVVVSYLLFILAIVFEIYGDIILISSDSALVWLLKHGHNYPDINLLLKCRCRKISRTRWCNSIGQYNLLSVWLKDKPTILAKILPKLDKKLRQHWYTGHECVSKEMKEFIFQQLHEKSAKAKDFMEAKSLCTNKCGEVLQQNDLLDLRSWSIDEVEFDQSILIWHIATSLCYHRDHVHQKQKELKDIIEMCKQLSDYMVYLLLVCPFMLPEGIGKMRSKEAREDAKIFFGDTFPEEIGASELLLTRIPAFDEKVGELKGKSVLIDGVRVAKNLESKFKSEIDKKWKMIRLIWVEILSYAAVQSKGPNHAQQLGRGGELLTHVWLLMTHLGITDKFQMPKPMMWISCR